MNDAGSVSAPAVLRRAVTALARGDGAELERLAALAEGAVLPSEEQKAAREEYAALGLLLALTRRNLRLLRGEQSTVYCRG